MLNKKEKADVVSRTSEKMTTDHESWRVRGKGAARTRGVGGSGRGVERSESEGGRGVETAAKLRIKDRGDAGVPTVFLINQEREGGSFH